MISLVAILPVLFVLSAFFSSSETVLFSLTEAQRSRIRGRNPGADTAIARCLADKAVLFSTILVGNTFVNFAISTIGYRIFRDGGYVRPRETVAFLGSSGVGKSTIGSSRANPPTAGANMVNERTDSAPKNSISGRGKGPGCFLKPVLLYFVP